jgi:putative transposase
MTADFHKTLPRLPPESYIGIKHVHFVPKTEQRRKLFKSQEVVDPIVKMLKEKVDKHDCDCIVYAVMPDHVHMILRGRTAESDTLTCHNDWKGETGLWLSEYFHKEHLWQYRSYDHVYRSHEYEKRALAKTINYILQNPVRAGLVECWHEYPFLGSLIGPYDIRHPYWWDWFDEQE